MMNNYNAVLTSEQVNKLEGLSVTMKEIQRFEEETRLQSQTALWYKIRRNRVTASNKGEIFKRRKEEGPLVQRLQSTRHVMTTAMRQGLAIEPKSFQVDTSVVVFFLFCVLVFKIFLYCWRLFHSFS